MTRVSDDVLGALARDEHARAARFPRERDGLLWARGRGVLRRLLARYLELEPAGVEFAVGPHGKPTLSSRTAGDANLSFNVSHSGALALCALSRAGSVGVDVEVLRARPVEEPAIARRALGAAEGWRLAALAGAERRREFLRAWTRHEAAVKCREAEIWHARKGAMGGDVQEPWIIELELDTRAAAALAVERRPAAVRCFLWRD